jgi:hypothetical protein
MNDPSTRTADATRRTHRPVEMLHVCCWCDPETLANLSEGSADRVQFGMCGDCLEMRFRELHDAGESAMGRSAPVSR